MTHQGQHPQILKQKQTHGPLLLELDDQDNLGIIRLCLERSLASQTVFARMMGASDSALSEWLAGKRAPPKMAARAAVLAAMMSGIPVKLPNPSQYLSAPAKRSRNNHVT